MANAKILHLHDELAANSARVVVETKYGPVTGGRAANNSAVWLGVYSSISAELSSFFDY